MDLTVTQMTSEHFGDPIERREVERMLNVKIAAQRVQFK